MIAFLHGDKKDRLETLSLPPHEYLKETKLQKELDLLINKRIFFLRTLKSLVAHLKK